MPNGIYEGCKETNGSTEVIRAPRRSRNRWVALDIIGGFNFMSGVVAIDGHEMWVYAADGSYIEPQRVHALPISNGERYSVLVETQHSGEFPIRFHATSAPQTIVGNAILQVPGKICNYSEPPRQWIDIIGGPLSKDVVYFNHTIAYPYPPEPVAPRADSLHVLNMKLNGASYLWAMNSSGLDPAVLDHEEPIILFHPDAAATRNGNFTILSAKDAWIDLVFYASTYPMPPHPIHKHGVKMFVIGSGTGPFKWKSVDDAVKDIPHRFNLVNPPRRDTVVSLPSVTEPSWVAVRYHASSPGAWMLHCHISNHMVGGMNMIILDGLEEWPTVPTEYIGY